MSSGLENKGLDGEFEETYDTSNIPISNYDGNDFDEEMPPEYSPMLANQREDNIHRSYDTYDPSVLDNDDEPNVSHMNANVSLDYTLGSTDIIVYNEEGVSPGFSHPAAKALAASIYNDMNNNDNHDIRDDDSDDTDPRGRSINVLNMTGYDGDFMADDDDEEINLAAGSALSAVRSRSQGNGINNDDENMGDTKMGVSSEDALQAAIAITGDSSSGKPSAAALQSMSRKEGAIASGIPRSKTSNKRSKIAEIRRGREPPGGISINADNDDTASESEGENKSKATKKGLARQVRESSIERDQAPGKSSSKNAYLQRGGSKKLELELKPEETEEEKAMRKEAAKALKAKTASMLAAIAEQKAKETEEAKKREDAQKKRKAILTARVVAEAAERRYMGMEDKGRYQPSNKDAVPAIGSRESKKKRDEDAAAAEANKGRGLSSEQSDALVLRLKARQAKTAEGVEMTQTMSVPARDFNDWKRKNSVPKDASGVFAMTGWYPCVKQALLDRGWFQNTDPNSPFFDLKWTLRSLECDQDTLQSWQLTNHFMKNIAITTKVGLIKSLRNLVWLADVHTNDVIPRGYDLSINNEMQTFIDDFRCQHALNILKELYVRVTGVIFPPKEEPVASITVKDSDNEDDDNDESEEEYYDNEYVVPPTPRMLDGSESAVAPLTAVNDEEDDEDAAVLFKEMGPDCDAGTETGDPDETSSTINNTKKNGGQGEKKKKKKKIKDSKPKGPTGADTQINACIFACCCAVLERSLRPTDDNFLDIMESEAVPTENNSDAWNTGKESSNAGAGAIDPHAVMSPLQWEIISTFDLYGAHTLPDQGLDAVDAFIPKEKENGEEDAAKGKSNNQTGSNSILNQQRIMREKKRKETIEKKERTAMSSAIQEVRAVTIADISKINRILHAYHKRDKAQAGLNGAGDIAKNIWIVKPGAKSRGRGIATFADLPKLLKYVDAGTGSAQASQWVVQKYMENPLTIAKHKFDIRQWVLVVDWNPLTIYFYDECYARFSVEKYTTSDEGLDNAYVHLVNNSISKTNDRFHIPIKVPQGDDIQGFMWSQESLGNWLQNTTGKNLMLSKIQPRMKEIAQWSLMCASECIEHRKNSWELYGFDFMVDDNYNAWLIEINSSPACDYSTKVTERYVQKALVELLSVTLDMRDWEAKSRKEQKSSEKPDTGGWGLIYKGPYLEMPTTAFGADMTLKGDALKAPKRNVPKPVRMGYDPNAGRGVITNGQGEIIESGGNSNVRSIREQGNGMPVPPSKEQQPQVSPFPNRGRQVNNPPNRSSASAPAARTSVDFSGGDNSTTSRVSSDTEPLSKIGYGSQKQQTSSNRSRIRSKNGGLFDGDLNLRNSLEASVMNDSIGSMNDSMGSLGVGGDISEGVLDDSDDDMSRKNSDNSHIGRGFPRGRSLSPARGFVISSIQPTAPTFEPTSNATAGNQPNASYNMAVSVQNNQKFKLDLDSSNKNMNSSGSGSGGLLALNMNGRKSSMSSIGAANGAVLTESEMLASEMKENKNTRQTVREAREQRAKDIVAARKVAVPPVGRSSAAVKTKVFELPF